MEGRSQQCKNVEEEYWSKTSAKVPGWVSLGCPEGRPVREGKAEASL